LWTVLFPLVVSLAVVVFSGVGLYVLVEGAITVVCYLALQSYVNELYSTGGLADLSAKASVVGAVFSIVFGAVLLLRARGLSSLLRRLRA